MKSRYENDTPIDNLMVVLDLLFKQWGDNTTREILRWPSKEGPYVQIGHHHDHSDTMYDRFLVTNSVADELLAAQYVKGKPQWGYTEMRELSITPVGERILLNERKRLELDPNLRSEWWLRRH
jgi:hypothetical protein